MKSISKSILLGSKDPIEGLAMAIVYSGVVEKDAKFFLFRLGQNSFPVPGH